MHFRRVAGNTRMRFPPEKEYILRLFKRNRKNHWERVYQKLSPAEVGWYQAYPEISMNLIQHTGAGTDNSIIDVGGGTPSLSVLLLDKGFKRITVLDNSENAIEQAKSQLGEKADRIRWIEADITKYKFAEQYDVWHDRAVFHFLTEAQDRKGYLKSLDQALKLNGHIILSTFGLDGPPKCSGLPVVRYSPDALQKELGDNFNLVESVAENHVTPSGVNQNFIYCRFLKQS